MSYDSDASNRLAAVRTAINDCLTAQDYSIAGRRKMMADLRALREIEKQLQNEVNAESDGDGMCSLGIQVPPSA